MCFYVGGNHYWTLAAAARGSNRDEAVAQAEAFGFTPEEIAEELVEIGNS